MGGFFPFPTQVNKGLCIQAYLFVCILSFEAICIFCYKKRQSPDKEYHPYSRYGFYRFHQNLNLFSCHVRYQKLIIIRLRCYASFITLQILNEYLENLWFASKGSFKPLVDLNIFLPISIYSKFHIIF